MLNSISANASELNNSNQVYEDTSNGRIVYDYDKYLSLLNSNSIQPFNSIIVEGEFQQLLTSPKESSSVLDILEPSSRCSNIFGHDWGDWSSFEEVYRIHFPKTRCYVRFERLRFCQRKHCNAYQIEVDGAWIDCKH